MKIAIVTENGKDISKHFGRAPMYVVLTLENGKVTNREKRLRSSIGICDCHGDSSSGCHNGNGGPGSESVSLAKHFNMANAIADCQVIIAGGMGYRAYASFKSRNMEPIITDKVSIDDAVMFFLIDKLDNLMKYLD